MIARRFRWFPLFFCIAVAALTTQHVLAQSVLHNPALASDSVIILSSPATSTPPVTVEINWPYSSPPPTTGTLSVTIPSGSDKIAIIGPDGFDTDSRSWNNSFPSTFQIRAKAKSSAANDVILNIQHDTGPVGSKVLTVSALKVIPPSETQDGSESGTFSIQFEPSSVTPASYEWIYQVPQTAGRHPTGEIFDDKTKVAPKVSVAQWFAPTNSDDRNVDTKNCSYQIKCRITLGGATYDSPFVNWSVWAYKSPITTPPNITKTITNVLIISRTNTDSVYTATVVGHTMTRSAPVINSDGMLSSNSFYTKIISEHEGKHVTQWTSEEPWSKSFDPNLVYQKFATETKTGSLYDVQSWTSQLHAEANAVFVKYLNDCVTHANATSHNRERDAHAISNGVNPPYLRAHVPPEYPNPQVPLSPAPVPVRK